MPEIIHETSKFIKYMPHELNAKIVKSATVIVFDDYEVKPDELIFWRSKKIELSSFALGLVKWNRTLKQYERHYYGSAKPIGQLKYVLVEQYL